MTLKQKSILTSLTTLIVFLAIIVFFVYRVVSNQFQEIENQRAERNIRRMSAVLDDRFAQLSSKLSDWTNWDDTYKFLNDENKEYVESNLLAESFADIGVDEALFIRSNGRLVASVQADEAAEDKETYSAELYEFFATGSGLLKIDNDKGYASGILKTDSDLLMYVVREVFRSDKSGEPRGVVIFTKHLDEKVINSLKNLTQFEASMELWEEIGEDKGYWMAKKTFLDEGKNEYIDILDHKTIAGYLVIQDVFGTPQAIIRGDIGRDISDQGQKSISSLIALLAGVIILMSLVNYWLLVGGVLKKISIIADDMEGLSKTSRLKVSRGGDEVDSLRLNINKTLDKLQESEIELSRKDEFIEKVMDNLTIGIAVNKISTGKTIYMNSAFEKIYGWSKEILVSVDEFFAHVYPYDKDNGESLKKKIVADLGSGDPERMMWKDMEITKSNGDRRYVDARNIPLIDQDLMVSTVIDVTDTKLSEDERKKYVEDLEKLNEVMVDRELRMVELKKQLKNKDVK